MFGRGLIFHLLDQFLKAKEQLNHTTLGPTPMHTDFWNNVTLYGSLVIGFLFLTYFCCVEIPECHDSLNWTPTHANVTRVRYERGLLFNEWHVRYRYFIDGERHFGERISIVADGQDSRSMYDTLYGHEQAKTPITIYVSPDDPSKSVYRPGFRASMFIFGHPIGFAILIYGIYRFARRRIRGDY